MTQANETSPTQVSTSTALRIVPGKGPEYLMPLRHPVRKVRGWITPGRKSPPLPGPVGLPAVGVWPSYNRDPAECVRAAAQRYGDIFRLPLPVSDLVILNHPRHYEITHIASDPKNQQFTSVIPTRLEKLAAFAAKVNKVPVDNPRRVVDEVILQRRSMVVPILARRSLGVMAPAIVDEFIYRTAKWDGFADSGQTADLQHELALVTMAAILRSMCSTEFSEEQMAQFDQDLRTLLALGGSFGFAPMQIGVGPLELTAAFRRTLRTLGRMIDERVASGADGDDVIGKVLQFTGLDGRPLTRAERIYWLFTLVSGGYDTLVASMSWMFAFLCLNPEPAERMYAEIDALNGELPTVADLKRLTWVKACFDEAQRLQGGPVHRAQAVVDVEIDGYRFPRGTLFGLGWSSMHRDERWWPDPDRYDPKRFADPEVASARPKTAFVPFGVGKLACPGQAMAYANAQLLSAVILQRFRFSVPPGWRPEPYYAATTSVKGGLPVTITRRG